MTRRYFQKNLEEMKNTKVQFRLGNFFALGYSLKYKETRMAATDFGQWGRKARGKSARLRRI